MADRPWKRLERDVATVLGGRRFPRWLDFGKSAPDVIDVAGFPELVIDTKLRERWHHHALLSQIREKYCKGEGQIPCLVTRQGDRRGAVACVPLSWLARLLDEVRRLRAAA